MSTKQQDYVSIGDLQIYYEVVGKPDGIPIVFHHGLGNCVQDWYDLGYIEVLKERYKLVLIDSLGFGRSSKPHKPECYKESLLMDYSIAVMRHLGIAPGEAVFFGNSMGGRLGYALMAYHPQWFKAFIIGGMHPYGPTSIGFQAIPWLEKGMDFFVEQMDRFDPMPTAIRARYLQNDNQAILSCYANYDDRADLTVQFNQRKIDKPILLFAGENDNEIVERMMEAKAELEENGEQVTLTLLKGLSHCQTYWDGNQSAQLIQKLISQFVE